LAKDPAARFADCSGFARAVLAPLVARGQADDPPAGTLVATPVITCPRCKKLYRLRVEMLGRQVRCKRCDTAFQLPGKRARHRAEKVEADTKSNPQARVETPRATPTAHGAAEPRRRWPLLLFALFACLGVL